MSEDHKNEVEELREKLNKALRERAALYQKSKQLEERIKDFHSYQQAQEEITRELLERQRELNFMLNRANMMLSRAQEANAMLSIEFTDIVKALPEPKAKEFESRIERINELFKKTGVINSDPDGEMSQPAVKDSIDQEKTSKNKFAEHNNTAGNRKDSSSSDYVKQPVKDDVSAETKDPSLLAEVAEPTSTPADPVLVESIEEKTILKSAEVLDAGHLIEENATVEGREVIISYEAEINASDKSDENIAFPPKRRPWWRYGT